MSGTRVRVVARGAPDVSGAERVSVDWGCPGAADRVEICFTVDAGHTLPESIGVEVWHG